MRLIQKLGYGIIITILLAGHLSCAPDKSKSDSLKLPPPEFVDEESIAINWRNLGELDNPSFSSAAVINFGPLEKDHMLRVMSICTFQNVEVRQTTVWSKPRQLSLGQLLPREIFLSPLNSSYPCYFKFVASNNIGSLHLFETPQIKVMNNFGGRGVSIKKDAVRMPDRTSNLENIELNEWSRYFVVTSQAGGKINLECERHLVLGGISDEIVPFAYFDAASAHPYEDKAPPLAAYPLQYCRAVQFINGQRAAFSPLMHVAFPASPLEIKVTYPKDFVNKPAVAEIQITNSNSHPLYFQLPTMSDQKAHLRMIGVSAELSSGLRFVVDRPGPPPSPTETLTLGPNENIKLKVYLTHWPVCEAPQNNMYKPEASGFWIDFTDGVFINEILQVATPKTPANSDGRFVPRQIIAAGPAYGAFFNPAYLKQAVPPYDSNSSSLPTNCTLR